jgi:hypothetical protein
VRRLGPRKNKSGVQWGTGDTQWSTCGTSSGPLKVLTFSTAHAICELGLHKWWPDVIPALEVLGPMRLPGGRRRPGGAVGTVGLQCAPFWVPSPFSTFTALFRD